MRDIEELRRAIVHCYGEIPTEWEYRLNDLLQFFEQLPVLENGQPWPIVGYLLWQISRNSLEKMLYLNCIMSKDSLASFITATKTMKEQASVEAVVDLKNFKAEVDAFDDIEAAISAPHLDISILYRYIAATQQNYYFLITDEMYNAAKDYVRMNPYRFTAYGEGNEEFMPLTWEEVYYV